MGNISKEEFIRAFALSKKKSSQKSSAGKTQKKKPSMKLIARAQFEKLLIFAYRSNNDHIYANSIELKNIGTSKLKDLSLIKLKNQMVTEGNYNAKLAKCGEVYAWDKNSTGDKDYCFDYNFLPSLRYVLGEWMRILEYSPVRKSKGSKRRDDEHHNENGHTFTLKTRPVQEGGCVQQWVEENLKYFDNEWPRVEIKINQEKQDTSKRIEDFNQYLNVLNYGAQERFIQDIVEQRSSTNSAIKLFLLEVSSEGENASWVQQWVGYRLTQGDSVLRGSAFAYRRFHEFNDSRERGLLDLPPAGGSLSSMENIRRKLEEGRNALILVDRMESMKRPLSDYINSLTKHLKNANTLNANLFIILIGNIGWIDNHQECFDQASLQRQYSIFGGSPELIWGDLETEDINIKWKQRLPQNFSEPVDIFLSAIGYKIVARGSPDKVIQDIYSAISGVKSIRPTELEHIWSSYLRSRA